MRRNRKRRSSVKKVVNALRQAPLQPGSKQPPRFRVEPHSFQFKPGIDLNKLNQLVDEVEVEEFRSKHPH